MAAWEFDKQRYADVQRTFGPDCRDARITAMYIDTVSNVATPPNEWHDTVWYQTTSSWQIGDMRDQMERDRLPSIVPYQPRASYYRDTADYPAVDYQPPMPMSVLAAIILASRRALGIADGSDGVGDTGNTGSEINP